MRRVKPISAITVAGGIAFGLAVLVGVVLFANIWRPGHSYTVSAYVPNARGIAQDSNVFEAGLPVGLVTGVQRNGPDAILTMRIDHGVMPLPVDSQVQLGLRSLAGETDVLLDPGHSTQTVSNGGSLGLAQDQGYTEVDQILNELAGSTEGKAREFFQGLGTGLRGEGPNLNQVLGGFASLVNDSPPVTSTLAAQHTQVADIVQNLGTVMNAIGQRTQALQEFAVGAENTFNAVAGRDRAFKQVLAQLPGAVKNTRQLVNAVTAASPTISPVLSQLGGVMLALKPAVDLLTPAAGRGIKLLDALGAASSPLKNVLAGVVKLKPSATAALPAVHATLCQLNPMIRFIDPYSEDIAAFFEDFGAVMNSYGGPAAGHELLASLDVDPSNFVRGVYNQPTSVALTSLYNFGVFHAGTSLGFHSLVPPGHISDPTIGVGDNGPVQWGATHKYPHVTADCSS